MLVESNGFILGLGAGLVMSFILVYKKLKELRSHIKKDEEMFDEKSNVKMKICADPFKEEPAFLNNIEKFSKIELKENLKGLNAFCDDGQIIIKFCLKINGAKNLLQNSSKVADRHIKIIRKKIKRGEIIRIPRRFIANEKIEKIVELGNVEIYSKEENKNIKYLLTGSCVEDVKNMDACAIMSYICLPNGRIISSSSIGNLCGMHKPSEETIKREKKREKKVNNYIWEIFTTEERGGISKKDFMEILAVRNEYVNKMGGFKAFNTGKFSEEKITYIQKEILKRKGNYSLKKIKIVEKAFFAYQEKDRIENRGAMVKGKAKRNDEPHLYLGKIEN